MKGLGILPFIMMAGMMYGDYSSTQESSNWNDNEWLEKEYNLIKEKKSKLGATDRQRVIYNYESK